MIQIGWILELEPGVYKAECYGRTVVLDNAKRYRTISAATHGLAAIRQVGTYFRNAKIYHDDELATEPAREGS